MAPKKRRAVRNSAGTLISGFNRAFEEMSRNNHFAAFLYEQFLRDLERVSKKAEKDFKKGKQKITLVGHALPIKDKRFNFLHMGFTPDQTYEREVDKRSEWLKAGESSKSFDLEREAYYSKKESWTIRKIMSLSKDFAHHMAKIGKETKIPLSSLRTIFGIITFDEKVAKSKIGMSHLESLSWVEIPATISSGMRDRVLLNVSERIYNLLLESLWVLIVAVMEDTIILRNYFDQEGLEEAKLCLLHGACYLEMEDRVDAITTVKDLINYHREEYRPFFAFYPNFLDFYRDLVRSIIQKGSQFTGPKIPQAEIKIKKEIRFSKKYIDAIQKRMFKRIFWKNSAIPEDVYYGEEVRDQSEESREDAEAEYPSYPKRRPQTRKYSEKRDRLTKTEKEALFLDISTELAKKLLDGFLANYKLQGHPANLIKWVRTVFDNISQTVLSKEFDKAIKEEYGVSQRTMRRHDKEIREGKIEVDRDPNDLERVPRGKDLPLGAIEEIKRKKELRQRHQEEGFLSRNQIIEALSNSNTVNELNEREDLQFQRLSQTTLKKRIKSLLQAGKIQPKKTGTSHLFRAEDLPQIAREIMALAKK